MSTSDVLTVWVLKDWCPAACDALQFDTMRQKLNRTIEAAASDKTLGGGGVGSQFNRGIKSQKTI
jgi:hypothetical protein